MNKLKFLFLFCMFTSAPEPVAINLTKHNDLNSLLESLEPGKALQVFFNLNSQRPCFESITTTPYKPLGDSWKLMRFDLLSISQFKGMVFEIGKQPSTSNTNACFMVHIEDGLTLSFQYYYLFTEAREILDSVSTGIDLYHIYLPNEIALKRFLPSIANAFNRIAYDRGVNDILLSHDEGLKPGVYRIIIGKEKTGYIPTLMIEQNMPKDIKAPETQIWFSSSKLISFPVRGNAPLDPSDKSDDYKAYLSYVTLILADIALNFKRICNWFDVIDPHKKGLYLEPTGSVSAATGKAPNRLPAINMPDIRSFLQGKKFEGAWVCKPKEGEEVQFRIKAIEIKKEPAVVEQQPAPAEPAPQPTSPGSGSSTDAATPTPPVTEQPAEPKIVIPQAAFESGLTDDPNMNFPLPNKRPKKDKILTIQGQVVYVAKEVRPTGCLTENQLSLLVRKLVKGENFSVNIQAMDLKKVIKAINEYLKELNISLIEEDHPAMVGNAHLMFAQYNRDLCFGIGKSGAQIGDKGHALKGGKPITT